MIPLTPKQYEGLTHALFNIRLAAVQCLAMQRQDPAEGLASAFRFLVEDVLECTAEDEEQLATELTNLLILQSETHDASISACH